MSSNIEDILRQIAESESFRWLIEKRYLIDAADEITHLRGQVAETEKQAARAIEEAKHDAEVEAERAMRHEFRSRGFTWDR